MDLMSCQSTRSRIQAQHTGVFTAFDCPIDKEKSLKCWCTLPNDLHKYKYMVYYEIASWTVLNQHMDLIVVQPFEFMLKSNIHCRTTLLLVRLLSDNKHNCTRVCSEMVWDPPFPSVSDRLFGLCQGLIESFQTRNKWTRVKCESTSRVLDNQLLCGFQAQ